MADMTPDCVWQCNMTSDPVISVRVSRASMDAAPGFSRCSRSVSGRRPGSTPRHPVQPVIVSEVTKFIFGVPRKDATKRFTGWS